MICLFNLVKMKAIPQLRDIFPVISCAFSVWLACLTICFSFIKAASLVCNFSCCSLICWCHFKSVWISLGATHTFPPPQPEWCLHLHIKYTWQYAQPFSCPHCENVGLTSIQLQLVLPHPLAYRWAAGCKNFPNFLCAGIKFRIYIKVSQK